MRGRQEPDEEGEAGCMQHGLADTRAGMSSTASPATSEALGWLTGGEPSIQGHNHPTQQMAPTLAPVLVS